MGESVIFRDFENQPIGPLQSVDFSVTTDSKIQQTCVFGTSFITHHHHTMGNTQPYNNPKSLQQCTNPETNEVDPLLYFKYIRNLRETASEEENLQLIALCELVAEAETRDDPSRELKQKRKREGYLKNKKKSIGTTMVFFSQLVHTKQAGTRLMWCALALTVSDSD